MKSLLLALVFLASCSWYVVGYQNQTALDLDTKLYADVHTLTVAKANGVGYSAESYGRIEADIQNCVSVYHTIDKSEQSLHQLDLLSNSLSRYKAQDSASAGAPLNSVVYFQQAGPLLDSNATAILNGELAKIKK